MRNAVQMLDLFRQHRTHARHLVCRQPLQRFDGQRLDCLASRFDRPGMRRRDLARQFGADVLVFVLGEMAVDRRRCSRVRRDRAPRRRGAFSCARNVEDVVARIGAAGELVLRLLRALLKKAQNVVAFADSTATEHFVVRAMSRHPFAAHCAEGPLTCT